MNKRCVIIPLLVSLFQVFCNLKVILNLGKIPEKRSPLRGKRDCTFVQALGDPGTTIHLARFTSILSHPCTLKRQSCAFEGFWQMRSKKFRRFSFLDFSCFFFHCLLFIYLFNCLFIYLMFN